MSAFASPRAAEPKPIYVLLAPGSRRHAPAWLGVGKKKNKKIKRIAELTPKAKLKPQTETRAGVAVAQLCPCPLLRPTLIFHFFFGVARSGGCPGARRMPRFELPQQTLNHKLMPKAETARQSCSHGRGQERGSRALRQAGPEALQPGTGEGTARPPPTPPSLISSSH